MAARTRLKVRLYVLHCFVYTQGRGYMEARTTTTQQSGQTPDKEEEIKNFTVYVSGETETETTGMLSPPTVWRFSVAADIDSNSFIDTKLIHNFVI